MPTIFLDPEETIPVVLDADATEEQPLTWHCHLVTPGQHARMMALIEQRKQAHLDTGGKVTDTEVAQKAKETETNFIAGLIDRVDRYPSRVRFHQVYAKQPDGTRRQELRMEVLERRDLTEREEIADVLCNRMAAGSYDDLLSGMVAANNVEELEGKDSASPSSPQA